MKAIENAIQGDKDRLTAEINRIQESHDWNRATVRVRAYVNAYFDLKLQQLKSEAGRVGAPLGSFELYEPTGGA